MKTAADVIQTLEVLAERPDLVGGADYLKMAIIFKSYMEMNVAQNECSDQIVEHCEKIINEFDLVKADLIILGMQTKGMANEDLENRLNAILNRAIEALP